jgi:hypothetical protein
MKLTGCTPGVALDSKERIIIVVTGDDVIAASLGRLGNNPFSSAVIADKMLKEQWASCFRDKSGMFFIIEGGVLKYDDQINLSLLRRPEVMESIQTAVEAALAQWPEWGASLRDKYHPRPPLHVVMSTAEA